MTSDPFEILREPVAPVAPRHAFTVDLKRRIADQLGIAPQQKTVLEVREYTPARLHSMTSTTLLSGTSRKPCAVQNEAPPRGSAFSGGAGCPGCLAL